MQERYEGRWKKREVIELFAKHTEYDKETWVDVKERLPKKPLPCIVEAKFADDSVMKVYFTDGNPNWYYIKGPLEMSVIIMDIVAWRGC